MAEENKVKDEEPKNSSEEKKTISSDTLKSIILPVITTVIATGISYYLFLYKKQLDDDLAPPTLPADWKNLKPKAIKEYLDKYIIGQDEAKIDASIALYNQLKKLSSDQSLPPTTLLLVGPTGSGKTTIAKHLGIIAKMPVLSLNATSFTKTGYVGRNLTEDIGREVFRHYKTERELGKEPAMIVVIDEFDKLKMQPSNNGPDIGGEGVQDQLLQLEQGTIIQYSPKGYNGKTIQFSTKKIMCIYLGAFPDIQNNPQQPHRNLQPSLHTNISHEDIRKYGFKNELVGRISTISRLEPPTKEILVKILKDPKDSIIEKYQNWFAMEGIGLVFNEEANEYIAEVALNLALGARGLNNIIYQVLRQYMYNLPSQQTKQNIEISKDDVALTFPSQGSNLH